jgi:heme exporter protein C
MPGRLARWSLLVWMCAVIWAAFFLVQPAQGFEGQASRIVFFHVPTAWVATLAFLVSCVASVMFLVRRRAVDDIRASSSAALGLAFAILATVTGSIFAKIEWGSFWNWDPRQTSITILLLMYAAYFALRGSIADPELRGTLSAAYAILAFIAVPFLVFVVPRIYWSLHPDVIGQSRSGGGGFDAAHTTVLLASLAGFTGLYAWIMSVECRLERLHRRRQEELLT